MTFCQTLDKLLPLRIRRIFAVIFGVIEMFFFGGIIFGFNALAPLLSNEKIYSSLCTNNQTTCVEQNVIFGYAFTTYMAVQMVMLIVIGVLIDNLGLRITKLGASLIFSLGALMFALTTPESSWLIFPAGCFLCVGGMACLICTFSISKLFNKTSVLVLAFVTGAFDASSCIFAIVSLLDEAGISYRLIFYILGGASLILNLFSSLFITTYWMVDMEKLQHETANVHVELTGDEGKSLKNEEFPSEELTADSSIKKIDETPSDNEKINEMVIAMYPTVWSSIRSLPFLLITLFFCFAMLRFNFFLSQLGSLIQFHFTDSGMVEKLGRILSFTLIGGLLAGLSCGLTIDCLRGRIQPKISSLLASRSTVDGNTNKSIHWLLLCPQAVTMLVVSTTAMILSCLVFVGAEYAYYLNFVLLVLLRGFLFSTISSFIMAGFPIAQFGTLYGLCGAIAGAFSCIQYAMLQADTTVANCIAFSFVPLMFCVPAFLILQCIRPLRKL